MEALQPGHFCGFLFLLPVCIRNVISFLTTKPASRSCCAMPSPPWDYTHSGAWNRKPEQTPSSLARFLLGCFITAHHQVSTRFISSFVDCYGPSHITLLPLSVRLACKDSQGMQETINSTKYADLLYISKLNRVRG